MASCLHPREIPNPLYGARFHRTGGEVDYSKPVKPGENTSSKYIKVPCNKCLNCRTNRQNEWAFRMEIENLDTIKKGGVSYFVTFTYTDDNLKYGEFEPTLWIKDVQDFHKRLRKAGFVFRNFTIGEYGGSFSRPHYHGMYFLPEYISPSEVHDVMFAKWNMCEPERFEVDPFSIADAKYIAKYSLKSPHIKSDGLQPPFAVCSKFPAIGASFLQSSAAKQVQINQSYKVFDTGGTPYNLPRYYKQRLFTPLERKKIVDEYDAKQYFYDCLEVGENGVGYLHYNRDLRALYDEQYRVNKAYMEDFGKDCRVSYADYLKNV